MEKTALDSLPIRHVVISEIFFGGGKIYLHTLPLNSSQIENAVRARAGNPGIYFVITIYTQ